MSRYTEAGFKIPRTIISSSQSDIQRHSEDWKSDLIFKPFSGIEFGAYETRMLQPSEVSNPDLVRHCSPIIQEHISGFYDVRLTIIGDYSFAARLMYREGNHPIDSRADIVPTFAVDLPPDLINKAFSLMDTLGLHYGAIDLRFDGNDYTFFEVNPEGQYLWIELETHLPISKAIAAFMLGVRLEIEQVGVACRARSMVNG